eukprot:4485026-Ditylum_brightwellii.AAC.1
MAYQRFTNLCERFRGDLLSKINADVESLDFMDRPCDCNQASQVNGQRVYQGKCRKMCIIYKAQCKICTEAYIGCTQNTFKARMTEHFSDVVQLTSTTKPALPEEIPDVVALLLSISQIIFHVTLQPKTLSKHRFRCFMA